VDSTAAPCCCADLSRRELARRARARIGAAAVDATILAMPTPDMCNLRGKRASGRWWRACCKAMKKRTERTNELAQWPAPFPTLLVQQGDGVPLFCVRIDTEVTGQSDTKTTHENFVMATGACTPRQQHTHMTSHVHTHPTQQQRTLHTHATRMANKVVTLLVGCTRTETANRIYPPRRYGDTLLATSRPCGQASSWRKEQDRVVPTHLPLPKFHRPNQLSGSPLGPRLWHMSSHLAPHIQRSTSHTTPSDHLIPAPPLAQNNDKHDEGRDVLCGVVALCCCVLVLCCAAWCCACRAARTYQIQVEERP